MFEQLWPEDIAWVLAVPYRLSERVGQTVYVVAFDVEGQDISGPPLDGPADGAIVRLGNEQAVRLDFLRAGWFGFGHGDIVLWRPPSEEWASELIRHDWGRGYVRWVVFVDGRTVWEVARSLQATWPRRRAAGDHAERVNSSVGSERKLGMLSEDDYFFSGRTSADCWDIALAIIREVSEGKLEFYEEEAPD